jgi:hypothetical protein
MFYFFGLIWADDLWAEVMQVLEDSHHVPLSSSYSSDLLATWYRWLLHILRYTCMEFFFFYLTYMNTIDCSAHYCIYFFLSPYLRQQCDTRMVQLINWFFWPLPYFLCWICLLLHMVFSFFHRVKNRINFVSLPIFSAHFCCLVLLFYRHWFVQ